MEVYAFSIFSKDTHDLHLEGYFIADGVKGISKVIATGGISIDDRELFNICFKIHRKEEVAPHLHYVAQEVKHQLPLAYKHKKAIKEANFFKEALEKTTI